nr:hypothetical protein [Tanacetum cinerariifolium]
MAFISLANTSSGKGEINTTSIPTASTLVSTTSADVAATNISHDTVCAYIASQSNGSQIKYEDITQIDEYDIEKMDIKWNMALLTMRADRFWKKTGKKITIQGTDVDGFDKSKVECFNCHKMGHFSRECRAPKSQNRGRRENFKQGSKIEEQTPKALMAIDREAPTEFTLMAKSSSDTEVEARLVEFKNQEIKFYEKIRGLEFKVESKDNRIERLRKELEELKKEKEGLDSKLIVYSPPKKDMSWIGLPKFADDTFTDYSRPSPTIESNSSDLQNSDSFVSEKGDSSESIMSKPMIKFVKVTDSPTEVKISKVKTVRKPSVKYAEMYRNTTKSPKFDQLAYDCGVWEEQGKTWPENNNTHKSMSPRTVFHKTDRAPAATQVSNGLGPQRELTFFLHVQGNSQNVVDDKGYWDSGCSRHMTGNIFYLSDYEPYDGGYVFFGQGGGKITGKCVIKTECIVLGRDFKPRDDTNVLLRTPKQHNMHNLVRGLPSKCFENDHTCVACLKGKQHKASCKTKLVHSVSKPLHTLHMDLFGPTSDETSGILRNFISKIENLKKLK